MAEGGNTYQLEPNPEEMFYPSQANAIIESVLTDKLKGSAYDPNTANITSKQLAAVLLARLKSELKAPRYRLACHVIIGQLKGQGLRVASKSLWDPNFDNWASYTFQNETLFCTGIVFGVYLE